MLNFTILESSPPSFPQTTVTTCIYYQLSCFLCCSKIYIFLPCLKHQKSTSLIMNTNTHPFFFHNSRLKWTLASGLKKKHSGTSELCTSLYICVHYYPFPSFLLLKNIKTSTLLGVLATIARYR